MYPTLNPRFASLIGSTVGLLLGVLVVGCNRGGPVALTTASPQHTYVVDISGVFSRPTNFFVDHQTSFTARRNGQTVATGYLHEADYLDDGFGEAYPGHDWPGENVLRFLAADRGQVAISDKLIIANESSVRVSFVKVHYCDLIAVLDLQPGAAVAFTGPRSETGFISAEAQLDGVTKPLYARRRVSLNRPQKPVTAMALEVKIGQREIMIAAK
jgi:hypothetical protein